MRRLGVLLVAILGTVLAIASPASAELWATKRGHIELFPRSNPHGGAFNDEFSIGFSGGCGPARVEIGAHLIYSVNNICGGRWRRKGRIPPPMWRFPSDETLFRRDIFGLVFRFSDPFRDYHRIFPVRIHFGGRMIERVLRIFVTHEHPRPIFEGTDAFVNFCIDGGVEIRSLEGTLYCNTQGSESHVFGLAGRA